MGVRVQIPPSAPLSIHSTCAYNKSGRGEMADTLSSGGSEATRVGSSPTDRTNSIKLRQPSEDNQFGCLFYFALKIIKVCGIL